MRSEKGGEEEKEKQQRGQEERPQFRKEFTKEETPADLEGGGRVRQAENETMEAEQFEDNRGREGGEQMTGTPSTCLERNPTAETPTGTEAGKESKGSARSGANLREAKRRENAHAEAPCAPPEEEKSAEQREAADRMEALLCRFLTCTRALRERAARRSLTGKEQPRMQKAAQEEKPADRCAAKGETDQKAWQEAREEGVREPGTGKESAQVREERRHDAPDPQEDREDEDLIRAWEHGGERAALSRAQCLRIQHQRCRREGTKSLPEPFPNREENEEDGREDSSWDLQEDRILFLKKL